MTNIIFRKGLVIGIIILFFGASVLPSISGNVQEKYGYDKLNSKVSVTNEELLDQENGETQPTGGFWGMAYPGFLVQSFKPTLNTLTRVELLCSRWGHTVTGELIVSIRSSKTGDNLTSITVPATYVPDVHFGAWATFDFPNITVVPEEEYYILWGQTSEVLPGPSWGSTPENYSRGQMWQYWNKTWYDFSDLDFVFRTYGYNYEGPVIEIEDVKGGFRASSVIINTGIGTAYDVEWSIDLSGGLIIFGRHTEGVISSLVPDESETIRQSFLFGIGWTTITVQAGEATKTASGFVLGPLVLGVT